MSGWTAIKGAAKYAAAVALGDIALPQLQEERAAQCRVCPHLTMRRGLIPGRLTGWCGPALREQTSPPTCGCLVLWADSGLSVDIEALGDADTMRGVFRGYAAPAGKVTVGSERCPQGKW